MLVRLWQTLVSYRMLAYRNRISIRQVRIRHFSSTGTRQFVPSEDPPSNIALVASLTFGLPLAVWSYKCLLVVMLQRKLIYMGYAPPGAREEDLTAYKDLLRGIELEEIQLRNAEHNCTLHGIVVRNGEKPTHFSRRSGVILIYLQGNAGNPLQRIPMFRTLLHACSDLEPIIVAVAPRSYWKSTRHTPTQSGLLSDYRQVVEYACSRWPTNPVFLYGHSLGANAGTCLASRMSDVQGVRGLILENPFSSIPDMVRALYPSQWVPYHYLGRFAWDRWDAVQATREAPSTSILGRLLREHGVLVLQSELDEVIPPKMAGAICDAGKSGSPLVIRGALHENAWESRQWRIALRAFLQI